MKNNSTFVLKNCSGVFTGEGFLKKNGRKIIDSDSSFLEGPLDVLIDIEKKTISAITKATATKTKEQNAQNEE